MSIFNHIVEISILSVVHEFIAPKFQLCQFWMTQLQAIIKVLIMSFLHNIDINNVAIIIKNQSLTNNKKSVKQGLHKYHINFRQHCCQ